MGEFTAAISFNACPIEKLWNCIFCTSFEYCPAYQDGSTFVLCRAVLLLAVGIFSYRRNEYFVLWTPSCLWQCSLKASKFGARCCQCTVLSGEGTLLISSCCSWDGSPAHKLRLQLNIICDEGITDTQAMSSSPLPCACELLSFHGHAGGAMPEPPIATGNTHRAEGTAWRAHVQTGAMQIQGQERSARAASLASSTALWHRLCATSVSLVWLLLGIPRSMAGIRYVYLSKPSAVAQPIMVANRTHSFILKDIVCLNYLVKKEMLLVF